MPAYSSSDRLFPTIPLNELTPEQSRAELENTKKLIANGTVGGFGGPLKPDGKRTFAEIEDDYMLEGLRELKAERGIE